MNTNMEKLQDLTAEEFALLNLIRGESDLVSISVKARLTPSESNAAVSSLTKKGLAIKAEKNISLTDNGKKLKDSKRYVVHGRVGAFRSYSPYQNIGLATETI